MSTRFVELAIGVALMSNVGCANVLGIEDTLYEPDDACALAPHRIFFADKVTADTTIRLGMVTLKRLGELTESLQQPLDPNLGHVLGTITDCNGSLLEDASLGLEPEPERALPFVVDESGVVGGMDTSEIGMVGALNVTTPMEVVLESYPDMLMGELASAGEVRTEPGVIATVVLRPNSEAPPLVSPPQAFTCVGEEPPPPVAANARITIDVVSSGTFAPVGQPIAGVRVRFCVDNGSPCAIDLSQPLDPSVEAETDSAGRAVLSVATQGPGFDGTVVVAGRLAACP